MNEKLEAFLTELSALTRKHGIAIEGCGCCGSPALYVPEPSGIVGFEYTVDTNGGELGDRLRRKDR